MQTSSGRLDSTRRQPVTLFGRRGQAAAHTAQDYLERNEIPLRWVDLDLDPLAQFVADPELRAATQPTALFADGTRLKAPENYAEPIPGQLERDPLFLESSQPGLFIAGDVRHGSIKRVASAVGEGAMAASLVQSHLAARDGDNGH